jgi:hypothetical protein
MQANRIGLPHFEQGRIPISAPLYNGFRCMDDIMLPLYWAGALPISLSPKTACSHGDGASMLFPSSGSLVNIAHFHAIIFIASYAQEPSSADTICSLSNTGRTTTGKRHEESSLSDGRYSRIRCTLLRS